MEKFHRGKPKLLPKTLRKTTILLEYFAKILEVEEYNEEVHIYS